MLIKLKGLIQPIIFVYSIPKTGSHSVLHSLHRCGYRRSFHFHNFTPTGLETENFRNRAKKLYELYVKPRKNIKIISCVREPVSCAVSDHYEWHHEDFISTTINEQISLFFKENRFECLKWFDKNMKSEIGIDIYRYHFDFNKNFIRLKKDNIDLLVIKLETDDLLKEKLISNFIGWRQPRKFVYERGMRKGSSSQATREKYLEFQRRIIFSDELLDKVYSSIYAKHFYSDDEIQRFRWQWSQPRKSS